MVEVKTPLEQGEVPSYGYPIHSFRIGAVAESGVCGNPAAGVVEEQSIQKIYPARLTGVQKQMAKQGVDEASGEEGWTKGQKWGSRKKALPKKWGSREKGPAKEVGKQRKRPCQRSGEAEKKVLPKKWGSREKGPAKEVGKQRKRPSQRSGEAEKKALPEKGPAKEVGK